MLGNVAFYDFRRFEYFGQQQHRAAVFPVDSHIYRVRNGYVIFFVERIFRSCPKKRV